MRRALFLDRDGVINTDHGYVHRVADFHFMEGIFGLCREAVRLGYVLIVVTNQSGIGRGIYSEEDFQTVTGWMRERFVAEGAPLLAVYHCPYHPGGNALYQPYAHWRKPAPGMILQAAADHGIDLAASVLLGDSERDIQAAHAAGVGAAIRFAGPAITQSAAAAILASHAEVTGWLLRYNAKA